MAKTPALTYESAFAELQAIVQALQDERVSVDELAAKVQRAAELIRFCREKLRQTEEDLREILEA